MPTPKLRNQQYGQRAPGRTAIKAYSPIVRELMKIMENSGYSQRSIAEAAGVTYSSITHWRKGAATPSVVSLETVAQVLGYEIVLKPIENED